MGLYWIIFAIGTALIAGWQVGVSMTKQVAKWKAQEKAQALEAERQKSKEYIRRSLDNRGFKILGGLDSELNLDSMLLIVIGELSSRSFPVAQDSSGSWHIYVYNRDGERKLMSRDDFELALFDVRDEPRNREKQAGLVKAPEPEAAGERS